MPNITNPPSQPPPFEWHGLTIQDLTASLDSRSSLARITVPPGAAHPVAWSRLSEKLYLVLAGQLHFYLAGTVQVLNPGELRRVPQGEHFAYANQTNRPVELVLVHTPRYDPAAEELGEPFFPRPLIYHIAALDAWRANAESDYTPAAFAQDGFIHLSEIDQVLEVAARYYRGQRGLVLLQVDPLRADAPLRYEDLAGSGSAYPHLYGALNRSAVLAVLPFEPQPDGTFNLPDGLEEWGGTGE